MKAWTKSLIGVILALLGFRSCDPSRVLPQPMYGPAPGPDPYDYPLAEYGTPSARFKFVGEAADENGKPVPGIRIVVAPRGLEGEGGWQNDTLYTDAEGKAAKALKYEWPDTQNLAVKFEDVDGEENGSFQEQVLKEDQVKIEQTGEGDGHWYQGEFTIQAKANLQKKAGEEE